MDDDDGGTFVGTVVDEVADGFCRPPGGADTDDAPGPRDGPGMARLLFARDICKINHYKF